MTKKRKLSFNDNKTSKRKKNNNFTRWLDLATNCGYNGYKIKEFSKEDGNCLFESILLSSDKYDTDDVNSFKEEISTILIKNKNKKYLNNFDETLEQIFCNFNDIQNYSYDDMIKDIKENNDWTRINTELLLNIMSKYYKLDFKIINNTTINPIKISSNNSIHSTEIALGHILEYHYLPLCKIN